MQLLNAARVLFLQRSHTQYSLAVLNAVFRSHDSGIYIDNLTRMESQECLQASFSLRKGTSRSQLVLVAEIRVCDSRNPNVVLLLLSYRALIAGTQDRIVVAIHAVFITSSLRYSSEFTQKRMSAILIKLHVFTQLQSSHRHDSAFSVHTPSRKREHRFSSTLVFVQYSVFSLNSTQVFNTIYQAISLVFNIFSAPI